MSRAAPRPSPTAAQARGRRRHRAPSPPLPTRVLLGAALVVVAVTIAAVVGLIARPSDDGRPTAAGSSADVSSSAAARTTDAAGDDLPARTLAWLRGSLPKGTRVLADAAAARGLAGSGLEVVTPGSSSDRGVAFVVSTPALRAERTRSGAVNAALTTSVPVASTTTSDGSAVEVRQVSTATRDQLARDAALRRSSERELLDNPAVRCAPSAAAVLRAGGLDLRAATVLALLAAAGPVQVAAIPLDPAEQAAGRPARTLVVRMDAAQLRTALSGVTGQYRLASDTATDGGARRLTWPVDVDPLPR